LEERGVSRGGLKRERRRVSHGGSEGTERKAANRINMIKRIGAERGSLARRAEEGEAKGFARRTRNSRRGNFDRINVIGRIGDLPIRVF